MKKENAFYTLEKQHECVCHCFKKGLEEGKAQQKKEELEFLKRELERLRDFDDFTPTGRIEGRIKQLESN